MICRETGYDDSLECECVKCKECKGEGIFVLDELELDGRVILLSKPVEWVCDKCNGQGVITEDCGIHAADEVPVLELGIPAKPARSETRTEEKRRTA